MTIRLMLAGEPSMVRDGVRSLLTAVDDFELVGETADRLETIGALDRLRPDVLVADAGSAGVDGIEVAEELTRAGDAQSARVVVLADRLDDVTVLRAARSGVAGYLLKEEGTQSLIAAVRAAADGEAWLSPPVARTLLDHYRDQQTPSWRRPERERSPLMDSLSDRELGVIRLLAQGRSNAEIAETLRLGHSTVKTHVSRILAKLELRDRLQLAAFAHQNEIS
jgi:DNA-binding NarL/FixJ family response regulator